MDNRKLVVSRFRFEIPFVFALLLVLLGFPDDVTADNHGSIRIYKLNKKGQVIKHKWSSKLDVDGCYNLSKPREAHRFAQIGYHYCQVFTKKDCMPGSEVLAMWAGKKYRVKGLEIDEDEPQLLLYRGSQWVFNAKKNTLIASLYCEY